MAARLIRGHWHADLRWNGKRRRKRSPVDSRDGAEAYAEQLWQWLSFTGEVPSDAALQTFDSPTSPKTTLETFAAEWFKTYVRTNLKPNTQRGYGIVLRRHILPFLGQRTVGSIGSRDIEIFKAACQAKGLQPKTINSTLSILRRCLVTALDWEIIAQLPRFRWLKVPQAPFDHLTPAESAALVAAVRGKEQELMVLTALRTGMRIGELRALHWEDIDLDRGFICVRRSRARDVETAPKNNRLRYVPISRDLRAALAEARRTDGHVFTNAAGEPLSQTHVRKVMHRSARTARLRRIGWHALRHTFATQLAAAGVPIHAISGFLGHSTLQMTMRYAHFQPAAFKDAVDLLAAAEMAALREGAEGTRGHMRLLDRPTPRPVAELDSAPLPAKNPAEHAGPFTWQGR